MVHNQDRSKLINHYLTLGIIPANTPPCNNITDGCQLFAVALVNNSAIIIGYGELNLKPLSVKLRKKN